jgi:DNA-binding transcriptional regulator YhcF (GntR family)
MPALTSGEILTAVARILICEDRAITFLCTEGEISIRFPKTRRLAEYLSVPHYYVIPFIAAMEEDGLVTRTERVGVSTTAQGTAVLFSRILAEYPQEVEQILGPDLLRALRARALSQ